jgi:hypothetical protein
LARETLWTEWKDHDKCRAYERAPLAPAAPTASLDEAAETAAAAAAGGLAAAGSAQAPAAKRAKTSGGAPAVTSALAPLPPLPSWSGGDAAGSGSVNLEASIGARKPAPSLAAHMEYYLECEDPEQVGAR